jgi:uncharacterized protein
MEELKRLGRELFYIETLDNKFFIFSPVDGSWLISSSLVEEEVVKKYLPKRKVEKYVDVRDIVLNTTNKCNLECIYCYVGKHSAEDLSYETGKKIIDKIVELYSPRFEKPVEICLHGSEPLMNWENIKKLIEYGNSLNKKYEKEVVKFGLQTNATLVDKEIAVFLKNNNVGVSVSIDGPEEIHNKSRKFIGNKPSFEETIRGIKILKHYYGKINALTVISKYNVNELDYVYSWLKESDLFDQVRFLFAHPNKYGEGIEHLSSLKMILEKYIPIFVKELEEFAKSERYFLNNIETRIITFALPRVSPVCGRCANSFIQPAIYIDIDGSIKECDSILSSNLEKYNILDVGNLEEILNSTENFRTSISILPRNCRVCSLLYFCGGGCPSEIVNRTNYYCHVYRKEYIEVMKRMPYFLKILNSDNL